MQTTLAQRHFLKFWFFFCLASGLQVLKAAPKGVIFYRPFPGADDSVTIVSEYSSIRLFPVVVNFVPTQTGTTEKGIERNRYIGYVEYPDLKRGTISTREDKESFYRALKGLQDALRNYPNAKKTIGSRLEEIGVAAQMLQQGNVLVEGAWRHESAHSSGLSPGIDLVIGARTYRQARLLSVGNGKAQVQHADGVFGVAIAALEPGQISALNLTSASVKIGELDHPAMAVPGNPVLQSNPVRSILTPLARSAGPSPHNQWGRDVRVQVGNAVKELRTLAGTLPKEDADVVRALADQLAFPFEISASRLRGRTEAEAALSQAIGEKEDLSRRPFQGGDHQIRLANAQRKITQAQANLATFDAAKAEVAEQLRSTDLAIARYLGAGDREPAQALAVCLYSLRDFEQLSFPFDPAVSRIWATMSSLDEATAARFRDEALQRVLAWAAFNWGAEQVEYFAWKKMLQAGQANDPLSQFFQMMILAGISSAAQQGAVQEIERNLEVAFFEEGGDARTIRLVLEHFLSGDASGETFTKALVEEALTDANPVLKNKAKVSIAIYGLLKDAKAMHNAFSDRQ